MPVRSLEEVDEVDAEGLFRLGSASGSFEAGRIRNRRTDATQYWAAFSFTSRAFKRNSPNCCNDVSSSRTVHPGTSREQPTR